MKSLSQMIKQLSGLTDTDDVTDWENQFIKDMVEKTGDGAHTKHLSPKQVEIIDRIYGKNFA